jgi:uncharacterized repeat protein (TIGR02543 family)
MNRLFYSLNSIRTILIFGLLTLSFTNSFSQTDIALGKNATATSEENDNGTVRYARYATDGNDATRWSSVYSTTPQSITIDLGALYSITSATLLWETASAADYTIQLSRDNITWDPAIVTRTNMPAATNRIDNLTFSGIGQFIRMTGTRRTTTYGYSLFAFKVYGTPAVRYTLNTNRNPVAGGTISLSAPGPYTNGTVVTLTAQPSSGFRFVNWSGDISGTSATTTITMNSNKTITATFTNSVLYTITTNASPSNGGSVRLDPPGGQYSARQLVTITALPATGFVFDGWNSTGGEPSFEITVTSNSSYTANFITENEYLQQQIDELRAEITQYRRILSKFSISNDGRDVHLNDANLYIRNGTNTDYTLNGLGNLIIGYNTPLPDNSNVRTGSHNLIIGTEHSYTSFGGFVMGRDNTISGANSFCGGGSNMASGAYSAVLTGSSDTASGNTSSILGGAGNKATSLFSTISGGQNNLSSGQGSSVSGGYRNGATGAWSSVSGGQIDTAAHSLSSISGGVNRKTSRTGGWIGGTQAEQ